MAMNRYENVHVFMEKDPLALESYQIDYRDLIKANNGNITSIEWSHFRHTPIYKIECDATKMTIDASSKKIKPLNLTKEQAIEAVKFINHKPILQISELTDYDTYYTENKKRHQPLPVWKISVNDIDHSCYYISPQTGSIRNFNTHSRCGFWMYQGLHSLNIKWLVSNHVVWTIVIWILLLGGTALSFTGIILGIKYMIRIIKRIFYIFNK